MLIKVNGEELEIDEGSTIQDAIEKSNAPYTSGSIVCLSRGKEELEKDIDKYKIKTTVGSVIIQMSDNSDAKPLVELWKEKYREFEKLNIRWATSNEVAIGPIVTDLEPTADEYKYFEGDVVLSLSSFSNESTHLIIVKENITNVYSVPPFNKGIFARVIGGKKTFEKLTEDDQVIEIEPIIERSTTTNISAVDDLSIVLEQDNELFTYVSFDIDENSPICDEHLFSLIKDNKMQVTFEANSFLGFYELEGLNKPKEDLTPRKRGTITVRNNGKGVGRVYVYRENRVLSPSHTTVGTINQGMELIDTARQNDFITVISKQQRIMTLNTTQGESNDLLSAMEIEQVREGVVDDDAIIVEQIPRFTVDIIKEGKVTTKGINKQDLCLIELYDEAPRSKWYFSKLTGLAENPIGKLKIHFAVPGMNLTIFEGDSKTSKGLVPENTPKDSVKAGEIGITNMAAKNIGLIGIRFEDNGEFGPTAESFEATNIVGKQCSDFNILKKLKEGDVLYVTESKP